LLRILGAEKVHFSYEYLHPDFYGVVNYMEDQGYVEAWPYFDPSGIADSRRDSWQTCLVEMNTLTDCFYRAKNLYDYIAVLDFDEIIMPVNETDMNWEEMITSFREAANMSLYFDAYVAQNVYYPNVVNQKLDENIPWYMYMLQHTERSKIFSPPGHQVKSFFGTERVLVVHNHAPHFCLNDKSWCNTYNMPISFSQNSHYRRNLVGEYLEKRIPDKTVMKFKDPLIKAVQKTLKDTGFNP
jgi:Glycosyltransferase family 92